jgi:membrane protease YdiL (CAAX protease family)
MTYKAYNQIHPAIQFLLFISIFIIVLIIGNIIGAGIVLAVYGLKTLVAIASLSISTPHFLPAIWILQLTGTTLPIFGAPIFFALVIVKDPDDYIKPSFHFPWILLFLVLAIMFISNPVIEFLSNLNQKMVLPDYLKWMRDKEDDAQKITEAMLQMKTIWDLIVDVLLIGLLTAIVEEFMFRGCLQTIFMRWTGNIHAAVWITAILFSAFHMEFFGFLPRLMLGVLFGYFVAWSGSIWTGVWAHFINNGTAVIATYLFQHKQIKTNPDDQHLFSYQGYVLSLIIILLLLFTYRRAAFNKEQIQES